MKLIIMGPPGAGKGTQAALIKEAYNIPHISTGDMFREAIKNGTEMGLAAKSFMDNGKLVPDSVVIGIIKDRIKDDDCKNGFILDGFPRTTSQAEALDEMGVEIDVVLALEVSDEKIVERMSGRRTCICGATYHTVYNPTKDNIHCDKCGAELTIRKDDDPAVVKSRLDTYHKETEPLVEFYTNKGIMKTVGGQESLEETTALVKKALGI